MFNPSQYNGKCPFCGAFCGDMPNIQITKFTDLKMYGSTADLEEPIVGWLVCIMGVNFGKDYRIRCKKNLIGQSENMDISIEDDIGIGRKLYASISFDQENVSYIFTPEVAGTILHNAELASAPRELNYFDVLQIGMSKFIFVPLCSPSFYWKDWGKIHDANHDICTLSPFQRVNGWLVSIGGECPIGRDYRIINNKNFIGRSEEMDISIKDDKAIKRYYHASITFDQKERIFMVAPKNGHVWLNNKAVSTPKEIHIMDILQIGNSKFLFYSLSSTHFSWD